jgi:hypothetical protein
VSRSRRAGALPAPVRRRPHPISLILTHGWLWTFWHWAKVIDPLADPGGHGGDPADAFEVLVPSFPGFGFSTPLPSARTELLEGRRPLAHPHDRHPRAPEGTRPGAVTSAPGLRPARAQVRRRAVWHPHRLGPEADLFNGSGAWDLIGGRPVTKELPAWST